MSDQKPKNPRSPINALKVLNFLRAEKNLPAVRKPRAVDAPVKLSRAQRDKLCRTIWAELFPQAVTVNEYVLPAAAVTAVLREFVKRSK